MVVTGVYCTSVCLSGVFLLTFENRDLSSTPREGCTEAEKGSGEAWLCFQDGPGVYQDRADPGGLADALPGKNKLASLIS